MRSLTLVPRLRVITAVFVLTLLTTEFWLAFAARAQKQHKRTLRARRKERHPKTLLEHVSMTTVGPTEFVHGFIDSPTTVTIPVSTTSPLLLITTSNKWSSPYMVQLEDSAPSDRQIMEELLKKYRFPDPASNISVGVSMQVERVLAGEQRADDIVGTIHHPSCVMTCANKGPSRHSVPPPTAHSPEVAGASTGVQTNQGERGHQRLLMELRRLVNYVWNPALIIENALRVVTVGKDTLEVSPGGVVVHQQRLQVIVEAETDFYSTFPFERRNCTLKLANEDPRAVWSRVLAVDLPSSHLDHQSSSLLGFMAERNATGVGEFIVESARMRAYQTVEVRMRRATLPWLLTLFLPTFVLLIVSCGVWAKRAPLVRLACFAGVFTTVHANALYAPRTGTVKAVDEWNVGVQLLAVLFLATCGGRRRMLQQERPRAHQQANGFYEEADNCARGKAYALGHLPYYTQLSEKESSALARCYSGVLSLCIRILNPLLLLSFLTYFAVHHVAPHYLR